MLFAAKIQKGIFLHVSEHQLQQRKDLCLTNFSLDEFESMAQIYLSTKHAKNVLIVSLEKPHLSAYHTSITLSHQELAHCKIQSRNGDVFVIGKWIDSQQSNSGKGQNQRGKAVENQKQQHKQEKKQKRIKIDQQSSQKRQQQPPARIQPVRQSSRVRTPSTSQTTAIITTNKSSSSSKGKSLLDMMNNLDEDDDQQSSFSEKEDHSDDSSSDESSSSSQKDQNGKKSTIAEKIRRKSMPATIKTINQGQKINRSSKRNRKESRKSESSDQSQEKSKKKDECDEVVNAPQKKIENEQQKPFNYALPTRLPDFLSNK